MLLKKIIVSLIFISTLTACSLKDEQTAKPKQEKIQEKIEQDYVEPYLDENPITLGLYQNKNNTKTLITSLERPLTKYQDIASF